MLLGLLAAAFAGLGGFAAREEARRIAAYVEQAQAIEREFIETLPIYEDFANPAREAELRTYLLADHLRIAEQFGVPPIERDADLDRLVQEGRLSAVPNTPETLYFYYNVPRKYRYLTPAAKAGLQTIAERFQQVLSRKGVRPPVKFAISSALRPADYQERLRSRNANASIVSTHSSGLSFDLFYDEYYVVMPEPPAHIFNAAAMAELRQRLGYLMGASLRRQFHAALMQTLLELQREGKLYAILEKRQRCYHVTILGGAAAQSASAQ